MLWLKELLEIRRRLQIIQCFKVRPNSDSLRGDRWNQNNRLISPAFKYFNQANKNHIASSGHASPSTHLRSRKKAGSRDDSSDFLGAKMTEETN